MANLREIIPAFFTGPNGQRLTPEQIAQRQGIAQSLMESAMDTSPTAGGWASVLAKGVQGYSAGRDRRLADRATEANATESQNAIAALLGGVGQSPSAPMTAQPSAMMPASGGASPQAASFAPSGSQLRDGIIETAAAIGADPIDLATAISYETAGTFDPLKRGPTTQWGQHRGLIQFGEPQARQNGVDWNDPIGSQLGANGAVANYFRSSGFKPGMSGLDLYSTINAGAPGRYGASDANNGGAPGDVRDKWTNQMGDHRAKALALLGDVGAANNGVEAVNAMAFSQPQEAMASPQAAPVQQAQAGGINPAIVQALSSPYVDSNTRSIAGMLLGQQMQQQESASNSQAQRDNWLFQQQFQQQQQANDPLRNLQIEQAQIELDRARNPTQGFKVITGPDAAAMGLDPQKAYNVGADGKVTSIGDSGVTVNNNMGGGKFEEEFAKGDASALSTINDAGIAAQRNLGRIQQLDTLLSQVPTGAQANFNLIAGNYGINLGEGTSNAQAAQALINSLVPEQRQPGSGPMSDADLELFKQSLPRIINQPGGNSQIINTMRAIAEYDAEGSRLVQRARLSPDNPQYLNRSQVFEALQNRPNPLANINRSRSNQQDPTAQTSQSNRTSSGVQWSID